MPDITISEARVKVIEAEGQILQILRQLQTDTGMNVEGIDAQIVHNNVVGSIIVAVRIKTEL